MLEVLNEDVLKLFSTRDHKTWFSFVQTCTYFQRFNEQEELKQKFLIKVVNIEGWKVQYRLPNGDFHNYETPSITLDGSQSWWQHGKYIGMVIFRLPFILWSSIMVSIWTTSSRW